MDRHSALAGVHCVSAPSRPLQAPASRSNDVETSFSGLISSKSAIQMKVFSKQKFGMQGIKKSVGHKDVDRGNGLRALIFFDTGGSGEDELVRELLDDLSPLFMQPYHSMESNSLDSHLRFHGPMFDDIEAAAALSYVNYGAQSEADREFQWWREVILVRLSMMATSMATRSCLAFVCQNRFSCCGPCNQQS